MIQLLLNKTTPPFQPHPDMNIKFAAFTVSEKSSNTIKQGDSDLEVMICFSTKFKLSVDLTVIDLGYALSHCHKRFVQ